jgi:hypothetical protein
MDAPGADALCTDAPGVDLGGLRIEGDRERIILRKSPSRGGEGGFSLIIRGPGRFALGDLTVKAVFSGEKSSPAAGVGFFASPPLVLRSNAGGWALAGNGTSGYTDMVRAEDSRGLAAVIGLGFSGLELLFHREEFPPEGEISSLFIQISRGDPALKR